MAENNLKEWEHEPLVGSKVALARGDSHDKIAILMKARDGNVFGFTVLDLDAASQFYSVLGEHLAKNRKLDG